jgi:hypothetical protein
MFCRAMEALVERAALPCDAEFGKDTLVIDEFFLFFLDIAGRGFDVFVFLGKGVWGATLAAEGRVACA